MYNAMHTLKPTSIRIRVGETGPQFLERTGLDDNNIDHQPVGGGVNFYELDWETKKPGTVYLEHGEHSVEFPRALSITGMENLNHPPVRIEEFYGTASITPTGLISHDDARKHLFGFLQTLLRAGWRQNILYNHPRLGGGESYRYFAEEHMGLGLPVDYLPTLEEWMSEEGTWYLYADGLFMKIAIRRDYKRMDPDEPGAYLLSFSVHSQEEYAKRQFAGEQREQWQTLWVEKIKELKRERYAKEKALAAQGYSINTGYQEPKIHPADPVEP